MFAHYTRYWRRYAWAGLVGFFIAGGLIEWRGPSPWIAFWYAACGWLWIFGFIGLALQVLGKPSPRSAWLADSAYWVYLVHMPVTIAFGALLVTSGLHPVAKIVIGIAGTTLVCLATYHLFVRSTWIGQLLNGKRHPRQGSGTAAATA
jgi:glucan biosynthesis protein C